MCILTHPLIFLYAFGHHIVIQSEAKDLENIKQETYSGCTRDSSSLWSSE